LEVIQIFRAADEGATAEAVLEYVSSVESGVGDPLGAKVLGAVSSATGVPVSKIRRGRSADKSVVDAVSLACYFLFYYAGLSDREAGRVYLGGISGACACKKRLAVLNGDYSGERLRALNSARDRACLSLHKLGVNKRSVAS